MELRFIEYPQNARREDYELAFQHLVDRIKTFPGVIGIIRFGNVTTPGISDIDLLTVFENKIICSEDPFLNYPSEYEHLLSHGIDAMSYDFFKQTPDFTFWFNSKCIWGDEKRLTLNTSRTREEEEQLKIQTAHEFLITNFIDLTLQLNYGIVKLRSMMQHVKGLLYDLEFMGVTEGKIYDCVQELRNWIVNWHTSQPDNNYIGKWLVDFYKNFSEFIIPVLEKNPVYVPQRDSYFYARNIFIKPGNTVKAERRGIAFPNSFSFLGKKYYNLQHRFNNWTFYFPLRHSHSCALVERRFEYFNSMKNYNLKHFPNFSHLTTGFSVNFG